MTATLERGALEHLKPDPKHRPKALTEWENGGAGEYNPELTAERVRLQWAEPGAKILAETVELAL